MMLWFICILLIVWLQNNNLERALDWIFTHPECEDESEAMSDTADTEPNNNSFSITNAHTDSSLSPDQDLASPRVRDGPGRKCLQNTEFNKQWSTTHTEDYTVSIHCWFYNSLPISFFLFFFKGYELFAFISHMGASTMSGHYVCHIKKEGRYADYNVCYLFTFSFCACFNHTDCGRTDCREYSLLLTSIKQFFGIMYNRKKYKRLNS